MNEADDAIIIIINCINSQLKINEKQIYYDYGGIFYY